MSATKTHLSPARSGGVSLCNGRRSSMSVGVAEAAKSNMLDPASPWHAGVCENCLTAAAKNPSWMGSYEKAKKG